MFSLTISYKLAFSFAGCQKPHAQTAKAAKASSLKLYDKPTHTWGRIASRNFLPLCLHFLQSFLKCLQLMPYMMQHFWLVIRNFQNACWVCAALDYRWITHYLGLGPMQWKLKTWWNINMHICICMCCNWYKQIVNCNIALCLFVSILQEMSLNPVRVLKMRRRRRKPKWRVYHHSLVPLPSVTW